MMNSQKSMKKSSVLISKWAFCCIMEWCVMEIVAFLHGQLPVLHFVRENVYDSRHGRFPGIRNSATQETFRPCQKQIGSVLLEKTAKWKLVNQLKFKPN